MYYLPQEVEVWYIIPEIRKSLARVLTKKYKLTYEKAGGILGVSKAAISQYLKNKRAGKIRLPSNVKKEVEKSAKIIIKDEKKVLVEMERLINLVKVSRCTCGVCKKYNKGILQICKMHPAYKK